MNDIDRQKYLQAVTRKLVVFTSSCLLAFGGICYILFRITDDTYLVSLVFLIGLIGGFVSLQQRLPKIGTDELRELSSSWCSVVLIPINGGIFAIVLMIIFLSGLIEGNVFPDFRHHELVNNAGEQKLAKSVQDWLSYTFPATGKDIAKLFFWAFVAGFSERFVPQIIHKVTKGN